MVEQAEIETLGAQGDGVTADGVFVPRSLPGEIVRITPSGHRAVLSEIVQAAPDRITPACAHFGICGGCAVQHASDGLVAGWKQALVRRALAARGIEDVEIRPIATSPPRTRRRATFTARRTKKGALIGFHAASSDQIVPITACQVVDPTLLTLTSGLNELVVVGASRKGELRVTVTTSDAGLDVAVTGGKPVEGPLYGHLVAIAATSDLARLSWDGEPVVVRRPPWQPMGRARVVPPPGGFLQATAHGEATLVDCVREAVGDAKMVADLFCGSGTFALVLAEQAEVLAVEAEAAALEALDAGWRHANELKRVETEVRDLYHRPLLDRQFKGLEAVVIDPPRQGARSQIEQLAKSDVPRIAAVSCNPATFARDARILLDGGYGLDWVQPVDQFRWSPHIELAAQFTRR
ncbi:MAG: methyltransferase [Pseudomonadota bacterium]